MKPKVNNKEELLSLLTQNKDIIMSFGVKRIGVFGSFAKNTIHQNSDIDILVEFHPNKKNFDNFMDLAFFIEDLTGRKVDLVTNQSLSKYIAPHILNEVEYVPFAA